MAVALESGTETVLTRMEGNVAVITLNRPDVRNALSPDMLAGLAQALRTCEASPDVRAVILTGAGKGFCAGGDVKGMASTGGVMGGGGQRTVDEKIHQQRLDQRATSGQLFAMPKPVIAALPGAAAGAGLALALACDLRVMSEDAVIATAFANVGFCGDYGGTYFLSQLVGQAKARELYFFSERVSAAEALDLGIVNKVVPADQVQDAAMEWAQRLANGPTVAYRYMKENFRRALNGDVMECLDMEATHHNHCGLTDDHKNAAQAFVDKKTPVFHGR